MTDADLVSLVHSMWLKSLNLEYLTIALCASSKEREDPTEAYINATHEQLKRLVKQGDLRRQRFLRGRPFYTIA